jgi:hypothetical protein
MSQSHPTLMQYLTEVHGCETVIARLMPSPLGETSPAQTRSPSGGAF